MATHGSCGDICDEDHDISRAGLAVRATEIEGNAIMHCAHRDRMPGQPMAHAILSAGLRYGFNAALVRWHAAQW